jgi:small subunit ribosomal protein S11
MLKKKNITISKKRNLLGIIHLQTTSNNTILTLTDLEGNTQSWASAGSAGFKNSRKSTSYAAQAAAEKLAKKAKQLGFNTIHIKMKGLGYGKELSLRGLKNGGLWIKKIEDLTPIPYNGCRPPKKRRK